MKRMTAAIVAALALGGAAATSATADYPAPNQRAAQAICTHQGGGFRTGDIIYEGPGPAYYCYFSTSGENAVSVVDVLDRPSLRRAEALCHAAGGHFTYGWHQNGPIYPDDVTYFNWMCDWRF
jgi:hypothetical protein